MNSKIAQASFEMLLILGLSLSLTVIGAGYYVLYSGEATNELNSQQVDRVFDDIISKTNRVFYSGRGNRNTIQATLPDGIKSITIENATSSSGERFNYINVTQSRGSENVNSLYFPSDLFIYLNCSFSCSYSSGKYVYNSEHTTQGPKEIRIESKGDVVYIDFVN